MTPEAKVVKLRQQGISRGQLPAPLAKLRDHSAGRLQQLLGECFDQADDALFALAEKAGSNIEQTGYFDAMRELRLQRQTITLEYVQWVARAFNEIGRFEPRQRLMGDASVDTDRDSLSLVEDSTLEEQVALDNMVTRIRNRYNEQILLLHVRVEHLLPAVKMSLDQMPLGPQVLCHGLGEAFLTLDMEVSAKLVLFKLFDKFVGERLALFYQEANGQLIADGVLPELRRPPINASPAGTRTRTPGPDIAAASFSGTGGGGPAVTFSELTELLHGTGLDSGFPAAQGAAVANVDTGRLIALLNAFQGKLKHHEGHLPAGNSLRKLVGRLVAHQQSGSGQVQRVDADVINLVSMLFDFVLEDRQLPEAMKALLARLQIPILKVALLDRGFFNRGGHPARKLLNELALAAVGWMPKKDGQRDPLGEKIETIVTRFINEFESDLSLVQTLLDDFSQFMDVDRRRRELVEQRLKDAEEGRARSELARTAVARVMAKACRGHQIPEATQPLVEEAWAKVLHWFFLREGNAGSSWKHSVSTLELLVWSVDPKPVSEGTRQALLKAIPQVVDSVREGLQTIGWDPFGADRLLRDLEIVHVDVLQALALHEDEKKPGPPPEPQALSTSSPANSLLDTPAPLAPAGEATDSAVIAGEAKELVAPAGAVQKTDAEHTETQAMTRPAETSPTFRGESESVAHTNVTVTDGTAQTGPEWFERAESLGVGSWLELRTEDERKLRCKLAAVIKVTGKYIFANRNGSKVAEYKLPEVASALCTGHLVLLDDGLLFDRALESVISNLRSLRKD